LYDHFIRKEPNEFWKCWSQKFRRNNLSCQPQHINGIIDEKEIADEFAKYFADVYYDSNNDVEGKCDFFNECKEMEMSADNHFDVSMINVELVDKCLRNIKKGKACGPDGLCCESLLFAHPKLIMLLSALFRSMAVHQYVPINFGKGIIVPLIKDKTGDVSSCNNYRAITLVPIISKLFEHILICICDEYLNTDDRQFGFKKGTGCANAIFSVRSTVDYFNDRGSTVYSAALDVSKAYDRVSHFRLFTALMRTGMPRWVVHLLVDWYSKLQVAVRWCESYSTFFKVGSGLRQGSSLSPSLFNVFINKVIVEMKKLELGCHINNMWVGCILYADDIILLSASFTGLQTMLNRCNVVINELRLNFNCDKSVCAVFGSRYKCNLPDITLNNRVLQCCNKIKYLGVVFLAGARMKCDIDFVTRKFYAASNCIFNNTGGLAELLQLQLQQAYCLPILQYATCALCFNQLQLRTLNACWNNVFRKIFKFNRWESVTCFINGLGFHNFIHLWYMSVMKFIKSMICSANTVLHNITMIYKHGKEHFKITNELKVNCKMPVYLIRNIIDNYFSNIDL